MGNLKFKIPNFPDVYLNGKHIYCKEIKGYQYYTYNTIKKKFRRFNT